MLIQQLTYLAALSRERHFGRAARACHVAQPTLSAGIRRLEAELGVQIVQRSQRFEGFTHEGERVLVWAQRILADCEGLHDDLGSMRHGLSGRLRLGAIPTSLPSVPLLTAPLRRAHPQVGVSIMSLNSRDIERGLQEFELHVGLTYLDNEPLRHVRTIPLYRERYLLLTPVDGPHALRETVTWSQAASLPLCLLSPDMQNRRIVDGIFAEAGSTPRPAVETNSISSLYAQLGDGDLSAVVGHPWLHQYGIPLGLRAIPLVAPEHSQSVGLVLLDQDPEPLLARTLCGIVSASQIAAAVDEIVRL
ncbi:MAG: LysR family transcriptional regulator [Gaiellales bacterium]